MLPLYLSPATKFPPTSSSGGIPPTSVGKFWGEENRRQSSRSKDPWATAEEFFKHRSCWQDPQDQQEKGRAGGETPTRGTGGFDRTGYRCNRGEGLRWLMHQCKHWSSANQCSPEGTSEMACQDFLLIYWDIFRESLGLSMVVCCIPRRQWRRKANDITRPKRHRLGC